MRKIGEGAFMLKRIENYINTLGFVKTTIRNAKNNPANLIVSTDALNGTSEYGYPIIHNNEILISNGGIIIGVIPFQTIDLFGNVNGDTKNVIVVDDLFYKLTKEAQDFIIYHEIGHIVYDHKNPCKSAFEYNTKRAFTKQFAKMEIEADNYAASIVGYTAGYNTLSQMLNILKLRNNKEDKLRIKNMKQHIRNS